LKAPTPIVCESRRMNIDDRPLRQRRDLAWSVRIVSRRVILVLGAGYVGAKVAELALARGEAVVLADNWSATRREQVEPVGALVEDVDIRRPEDVARVLALQPDRVIFLAAQASRPLSWSDPAYTEETNLVGARHVAEAVREAGRPPLVLASSLHVYGPGLEGDVDADRPYGRQGDLAHLSKVYTELLLGVYGLDARLLRLGIVYGPSPVEHDAPESVTVIDRFRRLAAAGEELTVDDGGRAEIGAVHVEDAARILLDADERAANVAAETVTVGQVAALARGEDPAPAPRPRCRFVSPFRYDHDLAGYLA
jgi:nucleoside-diphosphate-sugar epimerase